MKSRRTPVADRTATQTARSERQLLTALSRILEHLDDGPQGCVRMKAGELRWSAPFAKIVEQAKDALRKVDAAE